MNLEDRHLRYHVHCFLKTEVAEPVFGFVISYGFFRVDFILEKCKYAKALAFASDIIPGFIDKTDSVRWRMRTLE